MAGDDKEVGVKVSANLDQLEEAMNKGADAVREGFAAIKESLTSVGGAIEAAHKELLALFAGFELIKNGAEKVIDATVSYEAETIKLAKTLGITADQASVLHTALGEVFSNADVYAGAAQKLDHQIRSNEEAVNQMGLATRDSNGNLKDQQTLMLDAIAVVNSYKEGTDRNLAAQQLFGRGAGELTDLLSLNKKTMEDAATTAQRYSLIVGKQSVEANIAFRHETNELNDAFLGQKRAIADTLLPVLTEFESWLNYAAPAAIAVTKGAVGALVQAFYTLELGVKEAWDMLKLFANDMMSILQTLATVMDAVLRRDWKGAMKAAENGWEDLKNKTKASTDEMIADAVAAKDKMDAIWAKPITGADNKVGAQGTKTFEKPDTTVDNTEEKLALEAAEQKEKIGLLEIEQHRQKLEGLKKLDQISNDDYLAQVQALNDQSEQVEIEFYQKKAQIYQDDVVEKQKALDQIALIEQKHAVESEKLQAKVAEENMKNYERAMEPVVNAIDKSVTGIIQGTITMRKAMDNVLQSILAETVNMLVKATAHWIAGELAKTHATVTANAVRTASDTEAAAQSGSVSSESSVMQIMNNAWSAMAGAFQAMVSIPIIGPVLAVGAGAAAFAAVSALAHNVRSAETGYDIPAGINPLVQAHAKEMVLPAEQAEVIRALAKQNAEGGGVGGGSGIHLHVHALDHSDVKRYLTKNATALAPALARLQRNFTPGRPG